MESTLFEAIRAVDRTEFCTPGAKLKTPVHPSMFFYCWSEMKARVTRNSPSIRVHTRVNNGGDARTYSADPAAWCRFGLLHASRLETTRITLPLESCLAVWPSAAAVKGMERHSHTTTTSVGCGNWRFPISSSVDACVTKCCIVRM